MKPGRSAGLTQGSRCFRRNCFDSGLSDPTEVLDRVTEVLGCVRVSIVDAAAFGACPFPDVQGLAFAYVSARAAPLRGGEPPVYLHQRPAIPFSFVLKLTNELIPRRIADRFRQRTAPHWSSTRFASLHVLDRQRLDGDHVQLTGEARRELVQEVGSTVGYLGVCFCHTALLSLPVVARTIRSVLLLAGERLLLFVQATVGAVGIFEKARVAHLLAGRERDVGLKPYVNTDSLARFRKIMHRRFELEADVIPARRVLEDRDCSWFSTQFTT